MGAPYFKLEGFLWTLPKGNLSVTRFARASSPYRGAEGCGAGNLGAEIEGENASLLTPNLEKYLLSGDEQEANDE